MDCSIPKIRVPRSLLLCIAEKEEKKERCIAEQTPGEFAIVKEVRRLIAENKSVIALLPGTEGRVRYCYAVWENQEVPCWRVVLITIPNNLEFSYQVKECRFFYKDEKDRLKEIKGKVA